MGAQHHWLVQKAETLPLGNMFDPLATRIDKLFIAAVEAAALAPSRSLPSAIMTILNLIKAREEAHQVVEKRIGETLVTEEATQR